MLAKPVETTKRVLMVVYSGRCCSTPPSFPSVAPDWLGGYDFDLCNQAAFTYCKCKRNILHDCFFFNWIQKFIISFLISKVTISDEHSDEHMNTITANSDMLSNIDPWDPTMLSDSDASNSFHVVPVTWTRPTAKCQRCLHNHPAETGFHTAHAHILVFAAEASLVTVGWQTLLFWGNSCGIVACVLSRQFQHWHPSPNTVWHVTRQALLVCVWERVYAGHVGQRCCVQVFPI